MKYLFIIPLWITKVILRPFYKPQVPKAPENKPNNIINASRARYEEQQWVQEQLDKDKHV